ncbi:4'-phosphopantetheinyl transferase family protein [Flavisolibacter nicotianae]|uniref:4'-phosphopantetheinyl transferase family protein n=1 Tax=Flavisolibacter nicotianae TaxID=2364882 RepID=UPI000EB4AA1B|nr:4'-phosphopantetheinyl transferase superfamily protein [Flavisolibacter nicotianae]
MPIFFQQEIDDRTRLAIWKIEEEEAFFHVPLQREITHPHKRQQHLAGRYLLRFLFPDFPLELIRIADTRKPYLEDEAYHFSISHCSDYAAVIVSKNKRVGLDIEVPSPKVEKIKHKFLHEEELAMVSENSRKLQAASNKQEYTPYNANAKRQTPDSKLTLLWSAKEAIFKWWSYGNVDFSEMIRLQPFSLQPSGSFEGAFRSEKQEWPLTVHYRLFDQLCLAWVVK